MLDRVLPLLLLGYICLSWYLTTFEIAFGGLPQNTLWQKISLVSYASLLTGLLFTIGRCVWALYRLPRNHSSPPRTFEIPVDRPYICSKDGELGRCYKDDCGGRLKPPRTHHCSTCRTCKLEFDHHCPWLGTCITLSQFPQFLPIVLLAPIAAFLIVLPMYRPLSRHIPLAFMTCQMDKWCKEVWWDRSWSWIVVAGPPGHWIVGTFLGTRILTSAGRPHQELGDMIRNPTSTILGWLALGVGLSSFALIFAGLSIVRLLRGQTTLEAIAHRGFRERYLFVPSLNPSASQTGVVFPVLAEERPYDLGLSENWGQLLRRFRNANSHEEREGEQSMFPNMNPAMVQRITKMTARP